MTLGLITIELGCDLEVQCAQDTPMLLLMHVHSSRLLDLIGFEQISSEPPSAGTFVLDEEGNRFWRLVAPAGTSTIQLRAHVRDCGLPEPVAPGAPQAPVEELPVQCYPYLRASRYCESDLLAPMAWSLFGATPPGWERVQAICDWVHRRLLFDPSAARSSKTALEAEREGRGVCRDFAHLAVAFCRALNIPARYCTGYMGYTGVEESPEPIDYSGWFEAYLGGCWFTFDARTNQPRIGRVLVGRGRDAADVPILQSFGSHDLNSFRVITIARELEPDQADTTSLGTSSP
ncbi:transglutaminase-like domain-containing protein [Cyanobium sp. ATX 6F1]|uniref:transglutaminase-like domain-containing protein n=1 Tax=Cyanobium sp. ATX 6F1 TaxID=2823702 RepID=UPI0020CF03DC|nr:transglutaminase family protein [Cyanobium sp. ATX 6F1]